jgi:hypothetical protein
MERRNGRIVESPVEARQGLLGRPVLVVLVVSCTLAIVRSRFRSLVFSGPPNRQSQVTFHRITREALDDS